MARRWTLALVAACAARAGAHNATRGHSHGRSGHEHNGHGHGARAGEPRVRREIRTLPSAEFDALVGAMWTMKTLDDAAGKARFGPHFRTYDSFVAQHVAASLGARCDEAHFSPVFAVWHRAYLYEFELSLAAVDANVTALPYWDYRPDAADPGRPEGIFTPAMFGDWVGDAQNWYSVPNGRFAGWAVARNDGAGGAPRQAETNVSSLFGYLRGPMSMNASPLFSRRGGEICGSYVGVGNASMWDGCLAAGDIRDWHYCMDYAVHGMAHFGVGGGWPRYEGQPADASCFSFYGMVGDTQEGRGMGSYVYPIRAGCLDCPACVEGVTSLADCVCACAAPDCACAGLWTGAPELELTIVDPALVQVVGDMYDPISSPNDPAFMFHHANIDRFLYAWQDRHAELAPLFNYPSADVEGGEGYCEPHLLDSTLAPSRPFAGLFPDQERPLTPRDVFTRFAYGAGPYVYDTLE